MKARLCITGLVLIFLLAIPSRALPEIPSTAQYVGLVNHTEKWFSSDYPGKTVDLRLHTKINGTFNGAVIQEREVLLGDEVIDSKKLLFSRTEYGDILFHGDMEARVLPEPIVWVDAPLAVGKTWSARTPAFDKGANPDLMIHYVFACLEESEVVCPNGVFPAHRVFMATVYPDGQTTNCNFWYNDTCGLVRCCLEDDRVYLLEKVIFGSNDEPDVELDEPLPLGNPLGASSSPNPANPFTNINFRLPENAAVNLEIYDVAGRLVKTLVAGRTMDAGTRSVPWNGADDSGRLVASGTYLYRVRAGDLIQTRGITLVR